MTDDKKPVTISIAHQGAVRVGGGGYVHRGADGIACIYVDMDSKYAEIAMHSGGLNYPRAWLMAGDSTLHLDNDRPRDDMTEIAFPDYPGWSIFAIDICRYTLSVVLLSPEVQT
jgi:hypothetical protein